MSGAGGAAGALAALLAFAGAQGAGAQARGDSEPALELASANGVFEARVRKAGGQEAVADALARWTLRVLERLPEGGGAGRVEERWTCSYPWRGGELEYRLSEDGTTFAAIDRRWKSAHPIVVLHREGRELAKLDGSQLEVDVQTLRRGDEGKAWLEEGEGAARFAWFDGPRGPEHRLVLSTTDGERHVDAGGGLVVPAAAVDEVRIEPGLNQETKPPSLTAAVVSLTVGETVFADSGVAIVVRGEHPTPGYSLAGFMVALQGDGVRDLVIETRVRPPLPGPLPQVMDPFEYTATVTGLPPGRYRVRASRWMQRPGERTIEVLPAGALVSLRRVGGILGMNDQVVVHEAGVARVATKRSALPVFSYVSRGDLDAIRQALAGTPVRRSEATMVSDAISFHVSWLRDGRWVTSVFHDPGDAREMAIVTLLTRRL